jgi:hypothetical protein
MNVFLYRGTNHAIQSSGYLFISYRHHSKPDFVGCSVSLAYAVTWIMSQRIIVHLRGAYPITAQTRPIDPVWCLEAGAEQATVVVAQVPSLPGVPHTSRFSKETKQGRGFNGNRTIGSSEDSVNMPMPSDCDIHVHIERSVVMDVKPEGGSSIDRGIYASPKPPWEQGYSV